MVTKVDPCLFISKTLICVVYVDTCLFWECSQSNIDKVVSFSEKGGLSYNWENSKRETLYYSLGIYIKTLDDGRSQLNPNVLVKKVLEDTEMDYCNGFPTPTNVEVPLVRDYNGP